MKSEIANLHYLLHSASLLEEQLRRRLARVGVTHSQARVIDALARMGAVSQVTLSREFNITAASMSTMTARLVEAGFITRKVDPNEARSKILELTEAGQAFVSSISAAWRDVDTVIADTIGAERADQLAALTRNLRDGLGGKGPGEPVTKSTHSLKRNT